MPDQPNDSHTIFMPIVQGGTHKPLQQPAIYIDLRRCIGCNACSLACKQENNVSIGERWNEVYGIESLSSPTLDIRVMPMYCQHCNNAPCKQKCDSLGYHAIIQRPDGIVYIDPAKCVGCQQCLSSVNIRRYTSARRPVKWKSHLCMHRIDQGLAPACVITCLAITREFGEFTDLQALHPDAKRMGDRVRMLYGHLGEDPRTTTDRPTSSYPNPIPCHD